MKSKKAFALLFSISIAVTPVTVSAGQTEEQMTQQQALTEEQQELSLSKEDIQEEQTETETEIETKIETEIEIETETKEEQQELQQEQPQQETEQKSQQIRTVTITFDSNGAEGTAPESVTISSGEELLFTDDDITMTKQNHIFAGWSTEKDTLFQKNEAITVEKCPEGQTITLYAVWLEIQNCQILYDLGNNEIIREYTQIGEIPQNIPTQNAEGKQIIAWKNAENEIIEINQTILGNTAYTAVYEQSEQLEQPSQSESITLETEKHIQYMNGSNGYFRPEKALTRAEACQILYTLLQQKQQPTKTFSDVPADSWYANAVSTLATMGIVEGYGENFEPNKEMTKAEFLAILNRIYPYGGTTEISVDVPSEHWAFTAITNAAQKGWISPQNVSPDNTIKREEVAVILNKVLNRAADKNTVDNEGIVKEFIDVSPSHWAYYDILEASVVHEYEKSESENWTSFQKEGLNIPPGLYSQNGTLFYVEENGYLARDKKIGSFTFDENGWYTTGYQVLDEKLSAIVREYTDDSMTQQEKLHILHNYIANNYNYLKRPFVQRGQTGWEAGYAIPMLEMNKGNCYSFAALYYYLAKQIGYDAHAVIGTVGHNHAPHGWVEIVMNGTTYIFDAEMEMAYHRQGKYCDMFKKTYSNAQFVYIKW